MTPDDARLIADLDAAEKRATKAPWLWDDTGFSDRTGVISVAGAMVARTLPTDVGGDVAEVFAIGGDPEPENGALIAAARNALPRLLALVRVQDEALRLAEVQIVDLGKRANLECGTPDFVHALAEVRKALGKGSVTP